MTNNLVNLRSLVELSAVLSSYTNDNEIFSVALLSAMGKMRTMSAAIYRNIGNDSELILSKGRVSYPVLHDFGDISGEFSVPEPGVFALKIANSEEQFGWIVIGDNFLKIPFSEEEKEYISLLGAITANALDNAQTYRSLERRTQMLGTLFEMNREFSLIMDKTEIIRLLSLRLMGQLMVSRFAIILKEDELFSVVQNRLMTPMTEIPTSGWENCQQSFRVETGVEFNNNEYYGSDINFYEHLQLAGVSVVVPMMTQNETKGILLIGRKITGNEISDEEMSFLNSLASIAITALENERLFREEIEKKKMEEELQIARKIQTALFPNSIPKIGQYDVAAGNIPSKEIGGDYYDIISISPDEILFVIADVSGKGTPAALLMANTQAALRTLAPLKLSLSEMIARINDVLYQNTTSDKFVTLFCGLLHTQTNDFTYVNAGHNPPILQRKDGSQEFLTEGGLLLGIMESLLPYSVGKTHLENGDSLLLFTDGVNEALDQNNVEYGDKQLQQDFRKLCLGDKYSSQKIYMTLLEKVALHANGREQSDDITMIIIKK